MNKKPTPDDLRLLALEEVKLAADATAITNRRDEIKTILRANLPQGRSDLDEFVVTVSRPRQTLNLTAIAKAHPFVARPELYTTQLDRDRVKAAFAPNELAKFVTEGTPAVSVTVREDQ